MKNKKDQIIIGTILLLLFIVLFQLIFRDFTLIVILIEIISVLTGAYLLFIDKRNATSKFAWIFTLIIFPYIGFFIFLLIGRNPKGRKFSNNQLVNERKLRDWMAELTEMNQAIIAHDTSYAQEIFSLTGNPVFNANDVVVFHDGQTWFSAFKEDLKKAQHHIHLFYFIFKDDETGREIGDILCQKAHEGVQVRFMYDSLGSIKLSFAFLQKLRLAGVDVRTYDLVNSPWLSTRLNWRNHRKNVVIDGKIAYMGGMNVGNEYRGISKKFSNWRDTQLKIAGPSVLELQEVFLHDWIFLDTYEEALTPFLNESVLYFPRAMIEEDVTNKNEAIQIVYGGPYDQEYMLHDMLLTLIGKAVKSIKIATPYFVPDESVLNALRRAARSGIQVEIIIPGKGDRWVSFHGSNSFISSLLSANIDVYMYDPEAFLHCKLMIIDGKIATIGSTNFDVRSFFLNHELSAIVYGPSKAVTEVATQFEKDKEAGTKLTVEAQETKKLMTRLLEQIGSLFAPLL